jgi:hypothetical protein
VRGGGLPEDLDQETAAERQSERERAPSPLAPVEQHEAKEYERDNAVGHLGGQHDEGEKGCARGVRLGVAGAMAPGREVHDQERGQRSPTDPVVEHREGERGDALPEVARHRDHQDHEDPKRNGDRRMEPGRRYIRDGRREQETDQAHTDRHGSAEVARKPVACCRYVERQGTEGRVEITVRYLSRGDAMGAVEEDEEVVDVNGRDRAARKGQKKRADERGSHDDPSGSRGSGGL